MSRFAHTEWRGALYCEEEQQAITDYDDWDGGTCPHCNREVPATNRNDPAAET